MNKILNFIIWPAVAGLAFGIVLLQIPRLAMIIPGLSAYLPPQAEQQQNLYAYTYADAVSKAAPAVVSINSTTDVYRLGEKYVTILGLPLLLEDESTSLGSGVIISPDGYIITSFHIFELTDSDIVNQDPPDITITLFNGQTMEARMVSLDQENDLALLKVDATDLAYMSPAEQNTLDAGDIVLAIGNPRNIGQSVTQGIISALLRSQDSYVIQTDAAINPGSSGGALVDVDGRLVGINSTIVSESGGSEGISFAVPAQKAFNLMQRYIDQGPGGYLGVGARYINRITSMILLDSQQQGLWVEKVNKNGPADKAGLLADDIIINLAGFDINSEEAAFRAIQTTSNLGPGETVVATVFRNGEILTFPIVLGVGEAVLYYSSNNEPIFDPNPFSEGLLQ